jgi:hypothetical protein
MSDPHAEYEWQQQALQGRPLPRIAPSNGKSRRAASRVRPVLAVVSLALVAAGLLIVLQAPAEPVRVECVR